MKTKICKCGKVVGKGGNSFHSLCAYCNRERLNENKPKKYSSIKFKPAKKSPEGLNKPEFFREIWLDRVGSHFCVDGGKWLGETAYHFMFSHDDDVSLYKSRQWKKENVSLRCYRHHHLKDHGTEEEYKKSLEDKNCSCQPYFTMAHEYKAQL